MSDQGNFVSEEIQDNVVIKHEYFHEDDIALITNDSLAEKPSNNVWYIDSAATRHMTHDMSILMDYHEYPDDKISNVFLGNDFIVQAVGEGKVRLPTNENNTYLALHKVAYVPGLTKNLLSVPAMTQMDAKVLFDKEKCVVLKNDVNGNSIEHTIGRCVDGKLYCVGVPSSSESAYFTSTDEASKDIWHYRLGHLNKRDVNRMFNNKIVEGLKLKSDKNETNDNTCEGCVLGKMTKLPFPKKSSRRATKLLEIVHTDLCGPMQVPSHAGNKYVLRMI